MNNINEEIEHQRMQIEKEYYEMKKRNRKHAFKMASISFVVSGVISMITLLLLNQ